MISPRLIFLHANRCRGLLAACLVFGCQSAPSRHEVSPASSSPTVSEVQTAGGDGRGTGEDDERGSALSSYAEDLLGAFSRMTRARVRGRSGQFDGPAHEVVTLKRVGRDDGVLVMTAGFGLAVAPGGLRAELLAQAPDSGPKLELILSRLGQKMLEDAKQGVLWKVYEPVSLPEPISGLQFFDLRPGGEIDLSTGETVVLFKIFPLDQEEIEAIVSQRKSTQWVDDDASHPDAISKALARWAPALER